MSTQNTSHESKKQEVEKRDIEKFILKQNPLIAVSYSGHDRTFYITGKDAALVELAVLKQFPGMEFKTHSALTRLPKEVKTYQFSATGDYLLKTDNSFMADPVFECQARDVRNAKRKYGNFITSKLSANVSR